MKQPKQTQQITIYIYTSCSIEVNHKTSRICFCLHWSNAFDLHSNNATICIWPSCGKLEKPIKLCEFQLSWIHVQSCKSCDKVMKSQRCFGLMLKWTAISVILGFYCRWNWIIQDLLCGWKSNFVWYKAQTFLAEFITLSQLS